MEGSPGVGRRHWDGGITERAVMLVNRLVEYAMAVLNNKRSREQVPFRPRVVVADDDSVFRSVLVKAVEEAEGVLVGEAADGEEALKLCQALCPDWFLTNYQIPLLNAFEIATVLKRENCFPKVIVLSQSLDGPLRRLFWEQGIANCFYKNDLDLHHFIHFLQHEWRVTLR